MTLGLIGAGIWFIELDPVMTVSNDSELLLPKDDRDSSASGKFAKPDYVQADGGAATWRSLHRSDSAPARDAPAKASTADGIRAARNAAYLNAESEAQEAQLSGAGEQGSNGVDAFGQRSGFDYRLALSGSDATIVVYDDEPVDLPSSADQAMTAEGNRRKAKQAVGVGNAPATLGAGGRRFLLRSSLAANFSPAANTDRRLSVTSYAVLPVAAAGNMLTWNLPGDGTWNTIDPNFRLPDNTPIAFASGDAVTFDQSTGGTITIDAAGVAPSSTTVSASSGTYTFTGGPITSGTLVKSGGGTLTLASPNTYADGTTLSAGTLNVNAAGALGTGTFTVTNTATLDNTSGTAVSLSNAVALNGNLIYTGSSATTLSGAVVVASGSPDIAVNAGTLTLSGAVSGGALTKSGAGTLALSNTTNSYAGLTVNGGTVQTASSLSLSGQTTLNGGTLRFTGSFTSNSSRTYVMGTGGGTFNIISTSVAINTAITGTSLTKIGAGLLGLGGANGYTGGTNINAGTLSFTGTGLGTTGTIAFGGGMLLYGAAPTADLSGRIGNSASAIGIDTGTFTVPFASTIDSSNTAGLFKAGSGTLTLSAANAYTGTTTLSAGVLNINNANALGAANNPFVISGGTIDNTSAAAVTTVSYPPTIGASFAFTGTQPLALAGLATVTGDRTITVNASTLELAGGLNNSSSTARTLTKAGAGTLTLSGASTLANSILFAHTAGTLNLNSANALPVAGTLTIGAGTTLGSTAAAAVTTNAKGVAVGGSFTYQGPQSLTLGGSVSVAATAPTITVTAGTLGLGGGLTGTSLVTKAGAGALTLGGASTNSVGIALAAGTLNINNVNAIGTSTGGLTINAGTLDNTSAAAITTSARPVVVGGDFAFTGTKDLTLAGTVDFGTAARTVTVNGGTLGLSGVVSGSGLLTKAGVGALTLSGANTNTGGVTLSAGTLNINNAAALGTTAGNFTINGGTIDSTSAAVVTNAKPVVVGGDFAFTGTKALTLAGTVGLGASPRTITVNGGVLDLSGVVSGSGTLIKAGAGQLTLDGSNTFSGGATIKAGTLRISSNAGLGSSGGGAATIVVDEIDGGATLSYDIGIDYTGYRSILLVGPGNSTVFVDSGSTTSFRSNTTVNGTGALNKAGAGALVLTAANDYRGGTTISGGNLRANYATPSATVSSTGTGPVTVASSGLLGGVGYVNGVVTVQSGGTVSAGTSATTVGQLKTVGGQIWKRGGTFNPKFLDTATTTSGFDTLLMSTLDLTDLGSDTGSKFNVTLTRAAGTYTLAADGTYVLATVTGAVNLPSGYGLPAAGTAVDLTSLFVLSTVGVGVDPSAYNVTLFAQSDADGGYDFQVSPAPEPTTAALVGLGASAILGRRRRRRVRRIGSLAGLAR